jgi:tRNA threonylcarbamoyl adenosine modification protein YeaZ
VLVLGFDTATPAVGVALHDGERVVAHACTVDARRHGELLTPMIARVLAEAGVSRADLTGIAVGTGPGPYTGLRVGLVTARVLGAVLGIPVHGVCTLDIIAAEVNSGTEASPGTEFVAATDARRKEVYWARYGADGTRRDGPHAGPASEIPGAAGLPVAGEGGSLYPGSFGKKIDINYPNVRVLTALVTRGLAAGETFGPPDPLYLRRPDARVPGAPKRVTRAEAGSPA